MSNLVQSYLLTALEIEQPHQLEMLVLERLSDLNVDKPEIALAQLLNGDSAIRDEVWKFSASLALPHELLFRAYCQQVACSEQASLKTKRRSM